MTAAAVVFLLMDAQSGAVVRSTWPEAEHAAPVGSLVKPFTALAYARAHRFEYPHVTCRRCWSGRAHGTVGIEQAVAVSCNSYFRELARGVPAGTAGVFGLTAPVDADAETLIGLGGWKEAPAAILKAYIELAARRGEPGVAPLLEGMRRSAVSGTGKGVGLTGALVKTGTASCVHGRAPGDGYAVVLYGKYAVIVRVHSRPGAEAAVEAGRVLAGMR